MKIEKSVLLWLTLLLVAPAANEFSVARNGDLPVPGGVRFLRLASNAAWVGYDNEVWMRRHASALWRKVLTVRPAEVPIIAGGLSADGTAWILTCDRLYLTSNLGVSWSTPSLPIEPLREEGRLISAHRSPDDGRIWISGSVFDPDLQRYRGPNYAVRADGVVLRGAMFYSDDDGRHWRRTLLPNGVADTATIASGTAKVTVVYTDHKIYVRDGDNRWLESAVPPECQVGGIGTATSLFFDVDRTDGVLWATMGTGCIQEAPMVGCRGS